MDIHGLLVEVSVIDAWNGGTNIEEVSSRVLRAPSRALNHSISDPRRHVCLTINLHIKYINYMYMFNTTDDLSINPRI